MNIFDLFVDLLADLYSANIFLFIFVLSTVGITMLILFRLFLHFLIRLIGRHEASPHPVKFRVDENFDFVNGWRDKEEEKNREE